MFIPLTKEGNSERRLLVRSLDVLTLEDTTVYPPGPEPEGVPGTRILLSSGDVLRVQETLDVVIALLVGSAQCTGTCFLSSHKDYRP